MSAEHFFDIARERYEMLLRRQAGKEPPWTDDPVLRDFYFCNVFREDDRTTIWLRQHITKPLENRSAPHIIRAVAAFRWFNRIETGELIKTMLLRKGWAPDTAKHLLGNVRGQLWSGAYIIMPCPGQDVPKLQGVFECMADLDAVKVAKVARNTNSLEQTWRELRKYRGLGPFMAYEIVTDLAHTKVLRGADDSLTWANPGPGCLRGLEWVYGEKHTHSQRGLVTCMNHMWELLSLSRPTSFLWPEEWPQWDMRTVEHWLCEYDKYMRGRAGKHLKRRYRS